MPADTIIVAIGQQPHLAKRACEGRFADGQATAAIAVDETLATAQPGVFAAGRRRHRTRLRWSVPWRRAGRRPAQVVAYLTGQNVPPGPRLPPKRTASGNTWTIPGRPAAAGPRRRWPGAQPKVRRRDFDEVELGFTADQAVDEAKRCLQCASCCECRVCEDASARDIGAIDHFRAPRRITFASPAVIVADDEEIARRRLAGHGRASTGWGISGGRRTSSTS